MNLLNTTVSTFPLTTMNEIIAMNSVDQRLPLSDLKNRIGIYGPIPRLVFSLNQARTMRTLQIKMGSFDVGPNFKRMIASGELPMEKNGLSWWVVHIDANLEEISRIHWASDYIFNCVMTRIANENLSQLEDYIASTLKSRIPHLTPPTAEYQRWAASKIANGTSLTFIHLLGDSEQMKKTERFSRHTMQSVTSTLSCVKDKNTILESQNILFYSNKLTEALCDAIMMTKDILYLFQMTIGKKHNINVKTLEKYHKYAKENGVKTCLVFLVPDEVLFTLPESELAEIPEGVFVVKAELQPRNYVTESLGTANNEE